MSVEYLLKSKTIKSVQGYTDVTFEMHQKRKWIDERICSKVHTKQNDKNYRILDIENTGSH